MKPAEYIDLNTGNTYWIDEDTGEPLPENPEAERYYADLQADHYDNRPVGDY